MQAGRVDSYRRPLVLGAVHQFVNNFGCDANDFLTFPVADEIQ